MNDYEVIHNQLDREFYIGLNGDDKAYIRYRLAESQAGTIAVDFYTTYVPDEYRGKSLAGILVEAAFAWADENEYEIKASCWYAELKLKKRSNG